MSLAATSVAIDFIFPYGVLRTALLVIAILQAVVVPRLFKLSVERQEPPETFGEPFQELLR